jgi:endogenous inhibitor of DNA gyrase (YacG/DUF329 family)
MTSSSEPSGEKPLPCPICGKPAADRYRPFCSKRCADIDLGKWFSGAYGVAGRDEDEGDGGSSGSGSDSSGGAKTSAR